MCLKIKLTLLVCLYSVNENEFKKLYQFNTVKYRLSLRPLEVIRLPKKHQIAYSLDVVGYESGVRVVY